MPETIYTIPINHAFEQAAEKDSPTCPFCVLVSNLEVIELERIMGAAMMEDDIRARTNAKGFCRGHYNSMLAAGKRLSLALILESHLYHLRDKLSSSPLDLIQSANKRTTSRIERQVESCYLCEIIEFHFAKMLTTAAYMYKQDEDFRKRLQNQRMICLPHFSRYILAGKGQMKGAQFNDFYKRVGSIVFEYFDSLCEDVSGFCKMFDYRSEGLEWGTKKDSPERATEFLTKKK